MAPVFTGSRFGFGRVDAGAGASGPSYWIATLFGGTFEQAYGVDVDASENIYVAGVTQSQGAGSSDFVIAKYNSSGTIQWQRSLGGANSDTAYCITSDSSGNTYVGGQSDSGEFLLAKYDSTGAIQWQKTITDGTSAQYNGIVVDSSNNVYACGVINSSGYGNWFVAKFNSSGTLQWQSRINGNFFGPANARAITVDSGGNVCVAGSKTETTYATTSRGIKYNSSGTIQWQRKLETGTAYGIACDSSDNVYVVGATNTSDIFFIKYDSSGTLQWQRKLTGGSSQGSAIAIDASNNIYIAGSTNATGNGQWFVAKYNSSGTIQWQRVLGTSANDNSLGIAIDNSDALVICGVFTISPDTKLGLARLKSDGSLTGTYGVFTYSSSSLTDAAGSMTDSSSSETTSDPGWTNSTASFTDAATTLTSTVTQL